MSSSMKWVYRFDEVDEAEKHADGSWDNVRALLGGKGANLAEMTRIGVPVPPGFTVTTEACLAYLAGGNEFPEGMWDQVLGALEAIEGATGKRYGDASNPLLLSSRSGAKFSMPGMMDTVLDIGLNDDLVAQMIDHGFEARFAYDSYRRLIQMFGGVVLAVDDHAFEEILTEARAQSGVASDAELSADRLADVVEGFKAVVSDRGAAPFPTDPHEQLRMSIEAVFASWNGKRARDYRRAAKISDDLGTAVNIQTMVFGNMSDDSATGVAMSRNATTGEREIEGDFVVNAQGEDVVAGIRPTQPISTMAEIMPDQYRAFGEIAEKLEQHFRDMQDMEFTVERGKLWLLQTRDGKRTAQAAVRIAVDLAEQGLITQTEALNRVTPDQIDFFLHPQFDADARRAAIDGGKRIATGLDVSPGAAVGIVAFDADIAERWAVEDGERVVMVRPETKPDDVHGMLAAAGILTSRGGRTSHAALVARQFGKPAVVGVAELEIDLTARTMRVGDQVIAERDWISIDGTSGDVYLGALDTVVPDINDPWLMKLLGWADDHRTLRVRANADYPDDAARARSYGAQGIGLCRTEHMFFEADRLPVVRRMIMAAGAADREEALAELLPFQRADFAGLFRAMAGLPVTIRLLDPPLHEFLPAYDELTNEIADHRVRLAQADDSAEADELRRKLDEATVVLERVMALSESNPMLGLRGVRLAILYPELPAMQVRAIFEAACDVASEGIEVFPEIMIPLTSHVNELAREKEVVERVAAQVMSERGVEIDYRFGTMVETPRAAITADAIAEIADFVSFGTNDLTQTTFGLSRDDAEAGFLIVYLQEGVFTDNPFDTLDESGVGVLVDMAVQKGRAVRPDLKAGICGEHGGDPRSIDLCHRVGLDYVSCSPFRVPVARLAAAQAAIRHGS